MEGLARLQACWREGQVQGGLGPALFIAVLEQSTGAREIIKMRGCLEEGQVADAAWVSGGRCSWENNKP